MRARKSDMTTWALLVVAVLFALSPLLAFAQPTAYYKQFWASPDYSVISDKVIATVDAQIKGHRSVVSPYTGYLIAGVAGGARVDMNGVGGSAVGVYGVGTGYGKPGGRQDEIAGIYGRADKNGPFWAAGVHGECITDPTGVDYGGSCIAGNFEMIGKNPKSFVIGVNIQPRPEVRNAIGLQIQDNAVTSYRYGVSAPNLPHQFGDVDGDDFCMKFVPQTQRLEFWRACDKTWATRVGWIDMNFMAPDVQLNRR